MSTQGFFRIAGTIDLWLRGSVGIDLASLAEADEGTGGTGTLFAFRTPNALYFL